MKKMIVKFYAFIIRAKCEEKKWKIIKKVFSW